jgi:carboxyl-terminal processing protease
MPVKKAVLVEQAIPGTPAFSGGVLPGDMIVEIREGDSEESIKTEDFEDVHDAVRVLRGEPGSKVTITVIHEADGSLEDLTLERALIKIPGVRATHMVDADRKIGYLYLGYFHEKTGSDLKQALEQLREEGAQGVVIDLRFNPGGLLTSAVEVSDMFLDGGVIVSTEGRQSPEEVLRARSGEQYPGLALVVLVNRFSASASEIVAAALGENGRAAVVGEPTYGKASVQTLLPDPLTGGAVKLTTARYYTPRKLLIESEGVKPDPDRIVELTNEDIIKLRDDLARKVEYPARLETDEEATEGDDAEPEEEWHDLQLEKAVEVLAGMVSGQGEPVVAAEAAPQG